MQYADPPVRRSVPLALALLNISSPDMSSIDTLGRLSHDADTEVAQVRAEVGMANLSSEWTVGPPAQCMI